ncbi:hypothetical protein [Phenylobacterium montanum]|uniref:Uncharacterized protein n=1 Tax=Phenylobacterium montanum TaxID=2823693 RepID=A0A975G0G7_9CAUL|nr:hypothetical protein [Caulobacter sp. S6]QUD88835.1 hypothetical protein KCG34_02805 [Caulobacter sp. S6]
MGDSESTTEPEARAGGRLAALLKPFPILHAGNAGVNMLYTLGQTLVFARALDARLFSQTIFVATLSLYLLPVNQAVARANFVVVRREVVGGAGARGLPQVGLAFHVSQALMLAAGVLGPLLAAPQGLQAYMALAAFSTFNTLSNLWFFELQMAMLAVERPIGFEVASLLRRIANAVTLAWLWFSHDFLAFAVLILAQAVISQAWLMRRVGRDSDLFAWPRGLSAAVLAEHLSQLWTSVQATFAEWLTLNGPYALFTLRFGVGPALIALDAGMKLLRVGLTVTRNFSEIALPSVSRAVLERRGHAAARTVAVVLALSAAPVAVLAAALVLQEHWLFSALLAKNNVMPAGAGPAFALALIAGVGFQAGSHLVGHVGRAREVRVFTVCAAISFIGLAADLLLARPNLLGALWAVAIGVAVTALAGLWTIVRTLRSAR